MIPLCLETEYRCEECRSRYPRLPEWQPQPMYGAYICTVKQTIWLYPDADSEPCLDHAHQKQQMIFPFNFFVNVFG